MATTLRGVDNFDTAPEGLGKIIQVVQVTGTNNTTSSTVAWTEVAGTCSITPTSATSKILVQHNASAMAAGSVAGGGFQIIRSGTPILVNDRHIGYNLTGNWGGSKFDAIILDSPNTTSQLDYRFYMRPQLADQLRHNDYESNPNTWVTILMEIAA